MPTFHAQISYTATGTTQDFLVPFPFISRTHVTITQDGVDVAFTWINDGKVTVTPAVSSGEVIKIIRSSSNTIRSVTFSSPSSITSSNLNTSATQLFYLAQEALDGQEHDSDAATSAAAAATSAAAAAASEAAVTSNVDIWAGAASGVDTILLTPADALTTYTTGMRVRFSSAGANTGASTINISSLGAKTLKKQGDAALVADDIPASAIISATYDGTDFFLSTGTTAIKKATVINEVSGSNIASATTTDIGAATGNYINVTGTTTITGLGTIASGAKRTVQFAGALILTYNATSLILPSDANITTVAGDIAKFTSLGGGNWICTNYQRDTGKPLIDPTALTWTNTGSIDLTSGSPTAVSLVSSLSNVSEIDIYIEGFSTNTANQAPMIQLGDSGGLETSGYSGTGWSVNAGTHLISSNSTGFLLSEESTYDAANVGDIHVALKHMGSNVWVCKTRGSTDTTTVGGEGAKTLTAVLDRVSLTTSGGAATFDAGIAYVRSR